MEEYVTDPIVLTHYRDTLRDVLVESQELAARLQRELVRTHFGKFVVMRVDTGEYWVKDTEADAQVHVLQVMRDHPELSVATVQYTQIVGALKDMSRH